MKGKFIGNKRNIIGQKEKQKSSKKTYIKENTYDNSITVLAESIKGFKKDFDTSKNIRLFIYMCFEKKIEMLNEKIDILSKDNMDLKRDNLDLKRDNMDLKRDNNKYLKKKNEFLEIKRNSNKHRILQLDSKVQKLQQDITNLKTFYFSDQLIKLLKVMLKYIIEKYYKFYMIYDKFEKKLYFYKVPKIPVLLKATNKKIIISLNELLRKIIIIWKIEDNCIHFYDLRTMYNDSFKKEYIVFDDYEHFCNSLNIFQDAQKILINFIPEKYFTKINNYTIEENISNLLDNLD